MLLKPVSEGETHWNYFGCKWALLYQTAIAPSDLHNLTSSSGNLMTFCFECNVCALCSQFFSYIHGILMCKSKLILSINPNPLGVVMWEGREGWMKEDRKANRSRKEGKDEWKKTERLTEVMMSCPHFEPGTPRIPSTCPEGASHWG